jgi:hypothetical protein
MMSQLSHNFCKYILKNGETILFYGDSLNERHDFKIICNGSIREVQTLFFFDSRGISKQFENSLVEKIVTTYSYNHTILLVSRPLELTTWMTLYNFIRLNNITSNKIVTNMGFVDFTPKKLSVLQKSINQSKLFFPLDLTNYKFLEKFNTKSEGKVDLFQQIYSERFINCLEDLLKLREVIICNTPMLAPGYIFERMRPNSFNDCVKMSNNFNHSLNLKSEIIDFDNFGASETYDGVHYTDFGNSKIFSKIESICEKY